MVSRHHQMQNTYYWGDQWTSAARRTDRQTELRCTVVSAPLGGSSEWREGRAAQTYLGHWGQQWADLQRSLSLSRALPHRRQQPKVSFKGSSSYLQSHTLERIREELLLPSREGEGSQRAGAGWGGRGVGGHSWQSAENSRGENEAFITLRDCTLVPEH